MSEFHAVNEPSVPVPMTALELGVVLNEDAPASISDYRNFGVEVTDNRCAPQPIMEMDTRRLPLDLTAYELAQILNMTLRFPEYIVKRDFAAVERFFRIVEG